MSLARRPLMVLAAALALAATLPAYGASSARVVALKDDVPSWYTPAFAARVRAAGTAGVPVPAEGLAEIPKSGLAFTGIRPGAKIVSPAGCTTNFVFQQNPGPFHPNQTLYIGTAGHCVAVGRRVALIAVGPGTSQPVVVNMGVVVVSRDGGVGDDFALIQVDSQFNSWVSPSMTHWGGPTGAYTGSALTPVVHSGHGAAIGFSGTARAGVMLAQNNNARYWDSAAAPGDSGSGVNTAAGQAAANLTHLVVLGPSATVVAGTHISKILAIAGKPLSVCPTRTPWPLAGCAPA